MKRFLISLLTIATIFLFGCSAKPLEAPNTENVSTDNLTDLLSAPEDELSSKISDVLGDSKYSISSMRSYSVEWSFPGFDEGLDPEDQRVIVFDGTPIRVKASYENNGIGDIEIGSFIELRGVRQKFSVENDTAKLTDMYVFELKEGEKHEFELSFVPSVGAKGETLELEFSDMEYPSYKVKTDDLSMGYSGVHTGFDTDNVKLIFEADAVNKEKICDDFSGVKVSGVAKEILANMNRIDEDGKEYSIFGTYLASYLYLDSPAEVFDPNDPGIEYTDITVTRSKNQKIKLNLCGDAGTYRVAFYINHILQPVFDGCEYVDIVVQKNKQTEVEFSVDTTTFEEYNHCYYTIYKLDNKFDAENAVIRVATQKFIVK